MRRCLRVGDSLHLIPRRRAVSVTYQPGPDAAIASDETLDDINDLALPRYCLIDYLTQDAHKRDDLTAGESAVIKSWQEQPQRNLNLIGFARTLIYKRLGSSGPALIATLRRHRLRNDILLLAIDRGWDLPTLSSSISVEPSPTDIDDGAGDEELPVETVGRVADAEAAYARLIESDKVKCLRPLLFTDGLRDALRSDNQLIDGILSRIGSWDQESDTKLDALASLACDAHGSEKVVVFTEYADTAAYVADALAKRGIASVKAVTGSDANPTLAARRFSPLSNASLGGMPKGEEPIHVLVSTDVLSEGQNLQDARVVVNYDLPWAVVRMVQRAGRVDRIGQTADEVVVASMLPPGGVEEVIGNHRRIRERLDANAVVFGGGERFFGTPDEEAALRDAIYNEDPPDDSDDEVDVVSMAYEIWRTAQRDHPDKAAAAEALPNVVYSTLARTGQADEPGVLVHIQTDDEINAFALSPRSGSPPYAVAAREALRLAACEPDTPPASTLEEHHALLAAAFHGPLRSPAAAAEGPLSGVRSRCWNRLRGYLNSTAQNTQGNLLWDPTTLDAALDALSRRPLLRDAREKVATALQEHSDDNLAALVADLHTRNELCVPEATEIAPPHIICSMGLTR